MSFDEKFIFFNYEPGYCFKLAAPTGPSVALAIVSWQI